MERQQGKIRYEHSEKLSVLRKLLSKNFNYSSTERETGISRKTLKVWKEKFGKEVFPAEASLEKEGEAIAEEMKYYDIDIIRILYTIRKIVVSRLEEKLAKEENVEYLLSGMRFINAELERYHPVEEATSSAKAMVQKLTAAIMERNKGKYSRNEKVQTIGENNDPEVT